MRALSVDRPRSLPALTGGLLVIAVAIAQFHGAPAAAVIALGAVGLLATIAQTLGPAIALLRRHRSMVLLVVLAVALGVWIAIGLIDAGRVWNPFAPFRSSLADGSAYPADGYYWPPLNSWPWRINGTPLWPLVLGLICAGGGFALIADAVRVAVGLARPSRSRWRALTATPSRGGRITARAVPGVGLIVCAAFLGIALVDSAAADRPATQAAGAFIVGAIAVVLVISPVAVGLSLRLNFDKASLARERERQRFAAHLHDSVLQTLALIQRQAAEPEAVIKLASRQEHALRAWMAGEADLGSVTVTSAMREMLVEIEDEHGLKPELTVIGDAKLDERGEELVAAARESLRNVARHAGGAPVNVFLDIGATGIELFVRDSGPGFSFDEVPVERRGLRDSVIGRMHSVGGTATVDSTPGEGTEIALHLPANGKRR